MTRDQAVALAVELMDRPHSKIDNRPWFKRLLSSLKIKIALHPKLPNPIKKIGVSGKVDF